MRFRRLRILVLLLPVISTAQGQEHVIVQTTAVIGTAQQPTIEGGFIHEAEEMRHTQGDICVAVTELPDEGRFDTGLKQQLSYAARDRKFAYVLQRVHQWNLPATVALIPMVESQYQTHAVSPKGAKGAWQLMPETARDYGLKGQGSENFIASTEVALHLLRHLHQRFGDWTLAFAAYNAGSARVSRALRQHPEAVWIEDLALPRETKRYLARLKQLAQAMTS